MICLAGDFWTKFAARTQKSAIGRQTDLNIESTCLASGFPRGVASINLSPTRQNIEYLNHAERSWKSHPIR